MAPRVLVRVLVVERDVTLRDTLEEALHETGYATAGVGDIDLARSALQISPYPLVVLVGHGDPSVHDHSLVEEASALPPHAYLLLSTRPDQAPLVLNPHTQRVVPIVAEPCDLEALFTLVDAAFTRLNYVNHVDMARCAGSTNATAATVTASA